MRRGTGNERQQRDRPIEAYARPTSGANSGLVIYDGEDNLFTGPTGRHQLVLNNTLAQSFNPDNLPCTGAASGVDPALDGHPGHRAASPDRGQHQCPVEHSGGRCGGDLYRHQHQARESQPAGRAQTAPPRRCSPTARAVLCSSSTRPRSGTDYVTATFKNARGKVHSSSTAGVTWAPGAPTVRPRWPRAITWTRPTAASSATAHRRYSRVHTAGRRSTSRSTA